MQLDAEAQLYLKWFEIHPKLGISMMDRLYNRLDGMYMQKWRSNFPTPQAIENWRIAWAEAFEGKGITLQEVANAISSLENSKDEWPPSLPKFLEVCRPEIALPDPLTAYSEALEGVRQRTNRKFGEWSHPAIYWAAMPLSFELLNQTYSNVKQSWESALKVQLSKGQWLPIPDPDPEPAGLLAAPSRKDTEKVMRDLGVAKALKPRTDHRAWIDKVLKNKHAPMIARKFALEAQGVKDDL
jgi:hypothetical protein